MSEYKKQKKAMGKVVAQARLISKQFMVLAKISGKAANKTR